RPRAALGFVRAFVPVALGLTTTALGTLLPILHDNDMLGGRFGRYLMAAGAVGEVFPVFAIPALPHRPVPGGQQQVRGPDVAAGGGRPGRGPEPGPPADPGQPPGADLPRGRGLYRPGDHPLE